MYSVLVARNNTGSPRCRVSGSEANARMQVSRFNYPFSKYEKHIMCGFPSIYLNSRNSTDALLFAIHKCQIAEVSISRMPGFPSQHAHIVANS